MKRILITLLIFTVIAAVTIALSHIYNFKIPLFLKIALPFVFVWVASGKKLKKEE